MIDGSIPSPSHWMVVTTMTSIPFQFQFQLRRRVLVPITSDHGVNAYCHDHSISTLNSFLMMHTLGRRGVGMRWGYMER